jgi:hypothetical protein
MSKPIINRTTSVLGFRQGETIEYQPYATNLPTSWSVTGLPEGLTYNMLTGRIAGVCLYPGVHLATFTATNAAGASDPVVVPIGVEPGLGAASTVIDLSVDVETGKVWPTQSFQDIAAAARAWSVADPVFYAKQNDTYILGVRFFREKEYLDLPIDAIRFALKKLEPEPALLTAGGDDFGVDFLKAGTGPQSVWMIPVRFAGSVLAGALEEEEGDYTTLFRGLGELEWVLDNEWAEMPDFPDVTQSSRTFLVSVERDIVEN